MISKHFDVKVTLYFRIHDSEMYGGVGSIGYAKQTFDHCKAAENCTNKAAEICRSDMAKTLGVASVKLDFLSFEEYEAESGDSGEDGEGLDAHMVAVTRLKSYEDTGMEPEEIVTAIDSATKLIATMRNNKKAALWLKKYGPAEAGEPR